MSKILADLGAPARAELTNRLSDMGELEAETTWNKACRDHIGQGVRSDFGWLEDRRSYGLYCHAPGALEGSDKTEDTVTYLNTKVQLERRTGPSRRCRVMMLSRGLPRK
ncbi:hypothetical protein CBOM_04202 [Ceraceosorus bombacis]|uniref:Uncharacterized protein n=1 Tax=Ceraceosorus bombacis TaxID=401625 RepID=A0A0P1BPT3_9BASI|nr:hypothetical protein CBOM_04202 [Ceraceosorus bombacis]